jgi:hypothetical protein
VASPTPSPHRLTLQQFVESLLATSSGFGALFEWPPDVFGLTSAILKRTGAYRYAASPPAGHVWPAQGRSEHDWTEHVEKAAHDWMALVDEDMCARDLPPEILTFRDTITSGWSSVHMDEIADADGRPSVPAAAWDCIVAILSLHAIADTCCRGFGTPAAPDQLERTQFFADHLLSTWGSLSRLPKEIGVVLPKMRTPQSGLTLRAMSLYATWHETEVEVVWRSIPWANADEGVLNVLIVPWPGVVESSDFQQSKDSHFTFAPDLPFDPHVVVRSIRDSERAVGQIHVVVLPELALCHRDLENLQREIVAGAPSAQKIPLIVAGVRDWPMEPKETTPPAGVRDSPAEPNETIPCNCVILSAYFAGKWYTLDQDKHHRWRLDHRQVVQYNIGRVLRGGAEAYWWEDLTIPRRRLSVLAPTGWLALSPLLCEDLAQLEPVSELIRGIGPTLVVALLLDGPQLTDRWSARYASVLADDPGTSVLTVTALGMASRSLGKDQVTHGNRTVVLWRDQLTGPRAIPVDDHRGIVLTLRAQRRKELTGDGRNDHGTAAILSFDGVHDVPLSSRPPSPATTTAATTTLADDADLRELTTITQLVDATIDSSSENAQLLASVVKGEAVSPCASQPGTLPRLFQILQHARADRAESPQAKAEFHHAVDCVLAVLAKIRASTDKNATALGRWAGAADAVGLWLRDPEQILSHLQNGESLPDNVRHRSAVAVLLAVLWAIQNRLERRRRLNRPSEAETIAAALAAIHQQLASPVGMVHDAGRNRVAKRPKRSISSASGG